MKTKAVFIVYAYSLTDQTCQYLEIAASAPVFLHFFKFSSSDLWYNALEQPESEGFYENFSCR